MKISYENVASIRNATVDFEPGKLICIVGETNQGKSALEYTFVDAFTDSSKLKRWINNDALKEDPKAVAKISFVDDNGDWYQAEAGTGHTNYRVNKIKYEKPGRKSIFDLIKGQIPGLLYDPDDTRLIMNVQDEDSGLFPIDRPDTQIFKTYERLLSLSCTEDILRTIKLDTDELDFKISNMSSASQKSKEQIVKIEDALKTLDETKINELLSNLEANQVTIDRILKCYAQTYKDSMYVEACSKLDLARYQNTIDIDKIKQSFTTMSKAIQFSKYEALIKSIEQLQSNTIDLQQVQQKAQSLSVATMLINQLNDIDKERKEDEKKLKDIEEQLSKIDVCPYCHRPLEK